MLIPAPPSHSMTLAQTQTQAPAPEKLPTAQLEAQSIYLMRRGLRLETAMLNLTEAVRREPENAHYAVLLACAQAERAHVVCEALSALRLPASIRASQERVIETWEQGQQDSKSPFYGKPKPEISPIKTEIPRTKDDNRPFTLTEEAAVDQIKALSKSTVRLLEKSEQFSQTAKPEAQAEDAFLSGWTMLILWKQTRQVVPASWPSKNGQPEGAERIIAYLERALALQPENTGYRLGLADACQLTSIEQYSPFRPPVRFDKLLYNRSKALLLEVAKRRPRDGELWFRIACMEGQGTGVMDGYSRRTPENVEALRKASDAFPSNALVWYTLAAAQETTHDLEGMRASLERGNAAPDLLPIRYSYAVPILAKWVFGQASNQYPGTANLLAIGLMSLEKSAKQTGDDTAREKLAEITRQISLKYREAAKNPNLIDYEQVLFVTITGMMEVSATNLSAVPTVVAPSNP